MTTDNEVDIKALAREEIKQMAFSIAEVFTEVSIKDRKFFAGFDLIANMFEALGSIPLPQFLADLDFNIGLDETITDVSLFSVINIENYSSYNESDKESLCFLTINAFQSNVATFISNKQNVESKDRLEQYLNDYLNEHGDDIWPFFILIVRVLEYARLWCRMVITKIDGKQIWFVIRPIHIDEEIQIYVNLNIGGVDCEFIKEFLKEESASCQITNS